MPLYEYQCEACGHRFEKIQKFSDPKEDVCPACGGKVEKLISSPAFQFKGSGWYITDYAKKSSPESSGGSGKAATSEKSDKKDTGSSGDSSSSAAPAASTAKDS